MTTVLNGKIDTPEARIRAEYLHEIGRKVTSVLPEIAFPDTPEGNRMAAQRLEARKILSVAIINCEQAGLTVTPGTPLAKEGIPRQYIPHETVEHGEWYWAIVDKVPEVVQVYEISRELCIFRNGNECEELLSSAKFICKLEAPKGWNV